MVVNAYYAYFFDVMPLVVLYDDCYKLLNVDSYMSINNLFC